MENRNYKIRILPLFEEDLNETVYYISNKLKNPDAAHRLVDAIQGAIENRASQPEAFEQFHSVKNRQYPYYRIYVKNFIVFYVVIDDVMEVRRLIFNRKNYVDML